MTTIETEQVDDECERCGHDLERASYIEDGDERFAIVACWRCSAVSKREALEMVVPESG